MPVEPGGGDRRSANFSTERGFGRFRYTQTNIMSTNIPETASLSRPEPRNILDVHARTGTQIIAIEAETQKLCHR